MKHRALHAVSGLAGQAFGAALRLVVTSLVFTTGVVIVLRWLGVPMPSAFELLRQFEGLSKLAKLIS